MSTLRTALHRAVASPWPGLALLAGCLAVIEATSLDLWVQDLFYDFERQCWLVDAADPLGRLIFYDGPKVVIIFVALGLLVLTLGPARWRDGLRFSRRDLGVAVLTLITVPVLAGLGKDTTNTFTPAQIRRYGGDVPYVKLFEIYPANDRPEKRGRAFPAGHASGGFALLGLGALRRTQMWRRGAIALGLGAGWAMGGYQMVKGAHYLSHTVATMLLAVVVVMFWRRVMREGAPRIEQARPLRGNGG